MKRAQPDGARMKCPACKGIDLIVFQRNYRRSAFDGYRVMASVYCKLFCRGCKKVWKSRSPLVATVPDGDMETETREGRL